MQFDLDKMTVSNLLNAKKQYTIPRFQREYSWGKPQLNEFFDDIVKQIHVEDNKLVTNEYFWGTMLFIGSFTDHTNVEMVVVDGQQRITTITMFLSALAKILTQNLQTELSDKIWEYIIFKDDDLNEKAVLLNETPNPYFQRLVQKKTDTTAKAVPESEEEQRIKTAYEYFYTILQEKQLRDKFVFFETDVSSFEYVDLLKILRTQILSSIAICMSTGEKKEAGMIFEILNAKGKSLDDIDLIKNKIFEVMRNETPTDEAKNYWKQAKGNLASRGEFIDFSIFFHHYWISKYRKVSANKLYVDFSKTIKKNETDYLEFLQDMDKASKEYIKIIIPLPLDYDNKQELQYIVELFGNLNKSFNIKQHRIIILTLNYLFFEKNLISSKLYKKALVAIEYTHFIYNALLKQRTQWIDKVYSDYAIDLRKCTDKIMTHERIEKLILALSENMPSYSIFESKFIDLQYSKSYNETNAKCKYVVQTMAKINATLDVTPNGSSIEHIMDESSETDTTLSIGNLILLESSINSSIPVGADFNGKTQFYRGSTYPIVAGFLSNEGVQDNWTTADIEHRAKKLAHSFYYDIIGKVLSVKAD